MPIEHTTATAAALRSVADAIEAGLLPLPSSIDLHLTSKWVTGARLLKLADEFGEKIRYAPTDEDPTLAMMHINITRDMPNATPVRFSISSRDVGDLYQKGYADHNQRCLATVPE